MIESILIRADASSEIGTGHIMRCLALAQSLQHYIKPIFVCVQLPDKLKTRLSVEKIEYILINQKLGSYEDAKNTITLANKHQVNWIIVDGYQFSSEYQKIIKEAGYKLLFFDDYGHSHCYYADLILNQNFGANQELYKNREYYSKLLLGTDYTLLRQEFLQWQNKPKYINTNVNKILVTMGGGDPDNVTFKVIRALTHSSLNNRAWGIQKDWEIIVIVGGSNPHFDKLKSYCDNLDLNIRLQQNVTNMPDVMAWADIAIAAGGSTNWELAFMGLPSIVITIADNQIDIANKLHRMGLLINLGWWENVTIEMIQEAMIFLISDQNQREQMSKLGRQLIDGNGVNRVIKTILS